MVLEKTPTTIRQVMCLCCNRNKKAGMVGPENFALVGQMMAENLFKSIIDKSVFLNSKQL